MRYRIRPNEAFGDEIAAIATAHLQAALDTLESQPDGPNAAIHQARKKLKRVRGLYRLAAVDDPAFRKRENIRLRDAGRALSSARDATARVETLDFLADRAISDEERTAIAAAMTEMTGRRDAVVEGSPDLDGQIGKAIEACREAIAAIGDLDLSGGPRRSARRLARAWRKSLEKAHAALALCHDGAHEEIFHDLRKAAQAYWMNAGLLRAVWPSAMNAKRREAKALTDLLGHEHDISVLVALLDEDPDMLDGEAMSHLLGAIIREQQAIRAEALAAADRVFRDAPKAEAGIIRKLWLRAATE